MFLNIKVSKATPEKALKYASGKNLLEHVEKRNILTDNPAKEMRATAQRYGKWNTDKERKTFSLIISPDPSDNPTTQQVMEVTKAVLDKYFENIQGIIVLHKDRGKDSVKSRPILHAHFYGSVIDPTTGKNVHLSDSDVRKIRSWADKYAESMFGWRAFSRGQSNASRKYSDLLMEKINREGKSSWMSELKGIVESSYSSAVSFNDFRLRLDKQGIEIERNRNKPDDIQFVFPLGSKQIRVNGTSINDKFSQSNLIEKFTDFRRTTDDRQQRASKAQIKVDGGTPFQTPASARAGARGGERPVSKQRVDYGCIICTQDKLICKHCTEFRPERGDNSHGSRTR